MLYGMKVNPEKLDLLKEPFGILIKDSLVNKMSVIEILGSAPKIVSVGDTTTEKLIGYGIIPDISVIDGKEKRVIKTTKLEYDVDKVLKLKNNPGELNEEIISTVRELVSQKEEGAENIPPEKESRPKIAKVTEDAESLEKEKMGLELGKFAQTGSVLSETESKRIRLGDAALSHAERISGNIEYRDENSRFSATLSEKAQIVIDGEEDIVALPFLMFAPVDWVVCYGQPNEGLVIVKITEDSKKRAESIFNKVFI
jgi:uncharacterized protein (UPF0218 family)